MYEYIQRLHSINITYGICASANVDTSQAVYSTLTLNCQELSTNVSHALYTNLELSSSILSFIIKICILSRVGILLRDLYDGFSLHDWIYWQLIYSQLATTGNYSATAELHSLQFTVIHAIGFTVFTSRILATDL
jgi:hypothetical protein